MQYIATLTITQKVNLLVSAETPERAIEVAKEVGAVMSFDGEGTVQSLTMADGSRLGFSPAGVVTAPPGPGKLGPGDWEESPPAGERIMTIAQTVEERWKNPERVGGSVAGVARKLDPGVEIDRMEKGEPTFYYFSDGSVLGTRVRGFGKRRTCQVWVQERGEE